MYVRFSTSTNDWGVTCEDVVKQNPDMADMQVKAQLEFHNLHKAALWVTCSQPRLQQDEEQVSGGATERIEIG